MSPRAKLSACLICKNEEKSLEECLKSIRPFVEEIIVVDTGSTDKSPEIAKKYADKWELFTDCNDEEGIYDFSMARNRSFELASNDITMWLDCDDEIVGAENLYNYVEKYKDNINPFFIQFPYEYSYDNNGNCSLRHYRERIFFKDKSFIFVNPVHEVKIPKPGLTNISCETADDIVWKHKRQFVNKIIQPNRNLRILKKWYAKHGDTDARQLYYLGLEYGNAADIDNSKKFLNKYLELSGWDDEKYMALLRLIDYDFYHNDFVGVINHAMDAIKIKEDWGEAYFACAKAHYYLANSGVDATKNWQKCANFAKIGLSLPPTRTLLFVNPMERDVNIHRFLNFALNHLGDIDGALASTKTALIKDPTDQSLLANAKIYEHSLIKRNILQETEKLKNANGMNEKEFEIIVKTILQTEVKKEDIGLNNNFAWKDYYRNPEYPKQASEEDRPVAVVTPHSQAWGIPETFIYEDLPLKMTDAQLKMMTITVWKEFMLHDELLSAMSFLKNAPTRIRHSNEIEDLLRKTKRMVAWIDDEEQYDRHNAAVNGAGDLLGAEMVPLPQPLQGSAWLRMQMMTDRMPDKSKKILDLACIDGEFSNRWGLDGRPVVGVDCCSHSIKIANEAAQKHKTGVKHVQSYFNEMGPKLNNEKFDYITCGDVYEHLKDPVVDLLKPAREQVKDDGKMLLTCPHQSWTRGYVNMNMHPWLWGREDSHWLGEKNRAHVIAPTVWTTMEHFREAGWYVYDCVRVAQWFQEVPEQGNILVEAHPHAPKCEDRKDIVIFMGDGLETVSPHTIDLTGIGGSELAVREMSKRFAASGHRVRVFAGCGEMGEGVYQGVEWILTNKYHDINCDILIASRQSHALDERLNVKSKMTCLWVHDLYPKGFSEVYADKADVIFALSNWHKEFIVNNFPFVNKEKIVVTGNGIDFNRFDEQRDKVKRNPHKMIISSSPDRYLSSFIKIWPKVKARIPDAEAVLGYGFFNWKKSAELSNDQNQLRLIDELELELKRLEGFGVKMVGRLNQGDLAKEFLSSGVWGLPSWFEETNCISLSEGLAAGCAIVASDNAALSERITNNLGAKISGDWMSDQYVNTFAESIIQAMLKTDDKKREEAIAYARENLSWDKFASDWQAIFEEKLNVSPTIKSKKKEVKLKKYVPLLDR